VSRPSVVIVSPALEAANNGNWRTAQRWQQTIATRQPARITARWPDEAAAGDGLMLALHAGRSAGAAAAWHQAHAGRGLAVVLTGTDLYQDRDRPQARRSMDLAQRLVVLQSCALEGLEPDWAAKARTIYQSCEAHPPAVRPDNALRAVMVGHLREVKSPDTLMAAARLLGHRDDIRIDHVGEAGDPHWAALARQTQAECRPYRWLGGMPHAQARAAIAAAHVLVHTSAVEGGAHVIMEAVRSGTPVLASAVPGNIGMLGRDYAGYFPHGDAAQLAALLIRARAAQQEGGQSPAGQWLGLLRAQCAQREPLFDPQAERAALLALLDDLQDPPP
jgi:putative glycosyltransferase (TIGR04348 family)